ncbi:carboxypeptidase-like regulatory domain-containing protein [Flagellimonas sp. 2504JD1-5]
MKKLNSVLLVILFCYKGLDSHGQTITGIITDGLTGEKLPYVHVGVKNTSKGVISKNDGSFFIDLDGIGKDERLFFSMLGYEEFSVSIGKIENLNIKVVLQPSTISLTEVVVNPRENGFKKIKLGNYKNSTTTTGKSGNEEFGWGGEWGIVLPKSKEEYKIKNIKFHLRENTADSILFRVNVYRVLDKLSFESILKKPAYVTSKKHDHWITFNMIDQDVRVDHEILVTMEWVRVWYAKKGQNLIFFSHSKNKRHKVLHRDNSFGKWQVNKRPPLAIYLNGLIEK